MDSSSQKDDRPLRRHWELLLLLLALLMSFVCVFASTWLALSVRPEVLVSANMLPGSQADYRRFTGESTPFAPLDRAVGAEAATDAARLANTPAAAGGTPVSVVPFPPTPTITPTPTSVPTAPPTATNTPTTVASPIPSPTSPPSPTSTPVPSTNTPTTLPTATATDLPTATASNTPIPSSTPTSIPTATDTPVPPPTDTPEPPPPPPPPPPAPVVLAIAPNTQVNTNTVAVNITGLNFQPGCSATLDGVPLAVTGCAPSSVQASVPIDMIAGYYDLTVTNPDAQWGTLAGAYTATNPIPVVTGVTPPLSVITTTNLMVTITGDYFRNTGAPGVLRANVGGTPLSAVTYLGPTQLSAVVPFSAPGLATGAYTVTVTNPGPTAPVGSLANGFTVYTYTTTCQVAPACNNGIGQPDGVRVDIPFGNVITIDFGLGNEISDGPGYDMVFYEWPNAPGIELDHTSIQISMDGITWYTVFEWDDDNPGDVGGTNIDSYAADGESENELIPSSVLFPGPPSLPFNTGIAIDIGVAAQAVLPPQPPLPAGPFRWVRVYDPFNGTDPVQLDAIVRLN